ncbi:MAG: hypothetical protein ACYC7D_07495 [Nitrososphaerales archaeon]
MSSSDSILAGLSLATVVIAIGFCSSTAYRAFSLSRALPGQVHKTRAEWIGSFSIILIGSIIIGFASDSGFFSAFASNFLSGVYSYMGSFVAVFLFAWLSSTIGVASELDFFHRDTWHWRSFRKFFWAGVVLAATANILVSITELNPCVSASCGPIDTLVPLVGMLLLFLFLVLVIYTSIVLYLSSQKIQDKVSQRHLKWLAIFVVIFVPTFLAPETFPFSIFWVVSTYFLFRLSGFLTRAEKIESVSIHGIEAPKRKSYTRSTSLKYRVISLFMIGFSLFLSGIILNDDGLVKKLAPGNAEAFTSVTIIYGILFVLLVTKVRLGFILSLLSSTLWLFAQITNVLIPVNSFVTASNIALYFPHGFAAYVLGLAPVHDPTLCPYTCPPLQYSALISLVIQVPLIVSCYLGVRAERKVALPRPITQTTTSENPG